MTLFHIIAGTLALLSALIAVCSAKGDSLHRKAGLVFCGSMVAMSLTGAYMAYSKQEVFSALIGLLAFYLVSTGYITVGGLFQKARMVTFFLMVAAFVLGIVGLSLGVRTLQNSGESAGLGSFVAFAIFSSIAIIGALLDLRMFIAGSIQGKHRLARHLWRMCLALFLACAAFFLGQADEFPLMLQNYKLLSIPVIASLALIPYWIVRIFSSKKKLSAVKDKRKLRP